MAVSSSISKSKIEQHPNNKLFNVKKAIEEEISKLNPVKLK